MVNNRNSVTELARSLGFDLVGFAPVIPLENEIELLKEWLGRGYAGGMSYLEKNTDKRLDPRNILPSAVSVISLGLNYWQPGDFTEGKGKVSRYAWGRDYHFVLWERLKIFESKLKEVFPDCESISYVDTGPVMDKVWAVRAGIGWQGKHSNVINRQTGSWFFISNVFTNIQFEYDTPIADHCGSCTVCIDACPTSAIVEPYVVDGSKCISYVTIENKGETGDEFEGKIDDWIFGCDICQDVCPWNNKFSRLTSEPDFTHHGLQGGLNIEFDLDHFDKMENKEFKTRFAESPILRSKLKGMRRNSEFVKRNRNENGNKKNTT